LEKWAGPRVLEALRHVFAHYEGEDIERALLAKMDLFRRLGTETAKKLGCDYPIEVHERLMQWMKTT